MRGSLPACVVLSLALMACECDDAGPSDGGFADARVDAPFDAGVDAPFDAGRDPAVGPSDAGRDGPEGDAGWVPLPDFPVGCPVDRATRPEVLVDVEWTACGEGCERLVRDPNWIRAYDQVGSHDGSRGYFAVIQAPHSESQRIVVAVATDGEVLGAWRTPSPDGERVCQVGTVVLGPRTGVFFVRSGGTVVREERLFFAGHAELATVSEATAVLDEVWLAGSAIQGLTVSDTSVAGEVQAGGSIVVVTDGVLGRLSDETSTVGGNPQNVQLLGDTVYWDAWTAEVVVARGSLAGDEEVYLQQPGFDLIGSRVDGTWVAWQRASPVGGPYDEVEIWAARFEEDPSDLEPFRVGSIPGLASRFEMGGGYYAVAGGGRVELFELATRQRRVFTLPDGIRVARGLVYVAAEEMLVHATSGGQSTLLRVQLESVPVR